MSTAPKRIEIPEAARKAMIDLYNAVVTADQAFSMYVHSCMEQLGVPTDKPYKISDGWLAFELAEEPDGAAQVQTA